MPGKVMMSLRLLQFAARWRAACGLFGPPLMVLALTVTALAQEGPDERRCTGQWRASNEERINSCTALLDSGRYQPANLAILHHNRGAARRAPGPGRGSLPVPRRLRRNRSAARFLGRTNAAGPLRRAR